MPLFANARDAFRMLGPRRFLLDIPPWVLRRRYFVFSMAPADTTAPFSCRVPFRLCAVRAQDLARLVALRPGFHAEAQLEARLREGHLGFAGWSGDEIIHVRWVYVRDVYVPYLRRRFVLAPGDGYLDEVYTVPRWRGKGVETVAAYAMQRMLHAAGYRRVICAIAAWNLTPQRVAERQGYVKIGTAGYWVLPGVRRFFSRGLREDRSRGEIAIMP